MRRDWKRLAKGLMAGGIAMCVAVMGACEGGGGEGRSHDWRNNEEGIREEGIRPAEGGTRSGEGRGIEHLTRPPGSTPQDQRPTDQGGVREATPR